MPWGWILSALLVPAGIFFLALALFHVRVRAGWSGAWKELASRHEGSLRIEYGFPGFMRAWAWGEEAEQTSADEKERASRESVVGREEESRQDTHRTFPTTHTEARPPTQQSSDTPLEATVARSDEQPETASPPPPSPPDSRPPTSNSPALARRDRNRWRRALFRFSTDGTTWRLLAGYGLGTARSVFRLLRPRIAIAVGHPDPALLGRFAGRWYAVAPILFGPRVALELRFQDRRPTFSIRAQVGVSALSLVLFGVTRTAAFPWLGLGRRAWVNWWQHELHGWRAFVYKRMQG